MAFLLPCCDQTTPGTQSEVRLSTFNGDDLEDVSPVPRFYLSGLTTALADDLWLIEGELGRSLQGKVRRGVIPESLSRARRPLALWSEGEKIVLAPSQVLETGAKYSFIARGFGLIGSFIVTTEKSKVLYRWSSAKPNAGDVTVYCEVSGEFLLKALSEGSEAESGGGGQGPEINLGIDDAGFAKQACVHFEARGEGRGFFVPPMRVHDWLIDPEPVFFAGSPETQPQVQALEEAGAARGGTQESGGEICEGVSFLWGCALPASSALRLHLPRGAYVGAITRKENDELTRPSGLLLLSRSRETTSHVIGPLLPSSEYWVELRCVADCPPVSEPKALLKVGLTTGPPAARFVLNEVLLDPLGEEPQAEWVEILNIGTKAGSLAQLEIWDSSGGSPLEDIDLEPGQFGLIVRKDFSLGDDQVPDAGSLPIFVDSIGKNGLRNSGERVSLRDSSGRILSEIPAIATPPGVSLARRSPWLGDQKSSFTVSSGDGSSPGLKNDVEEK